MGESQGGLGWGDMPGGAGGWPAIPGGQTSEEAVRRAPAAPEPVLGIVIAAAAALVMLTALLPWATATLNIPGLGLLPGSAGDELTGSRGYAGVRGLPGMATLAAGLAAVLLGGAGAMLGRRMAAFAAIPAVVVLAALAEFLVFLPEETAELYGDSPNQLPLPPGQILGFSIESRLAFGWWLTLALALVVLGGAFMSTTRRPDQETA